MTKEENNERTETCPYYIEAIKNGTLKEWHEQQVLPNAQIILVYRSNVGHYSCNPKCAIENKCKGTTGLCPIPINCTFICAISNSCNIQA